MTFSLSITDGANRVALAQLITAERTAPKNRICANTGVCCKIKVGKYGFAVYGCFMVMAETDGFVKIIADAETDEVLGFGIVGYAASDLISECVLALEMGAFLPDLALTVHPHPTLGEAIMEAAKAALGESPHLIGGGQRRAGAK